jgi:formate/nitrite transporter FocA (FNT family)
MSQRIQLLIIRSIVAGLLISLAGVIYLNCTDKIVGSCLFSIGLIAVILLNTNLYTGKVGYVDSKSKFFDVLIILGINSLTAFIAGCMYQLNMGPSEIWEATKLVKPWHRVFWDGLICGVLIYLAVELYKRSKNLLTVVLPVMGFILGGAEHSIADCFYIGAGANWSFKTLGYISLIIVGNGLGSFIFHTLCKWEGNNNKVII